MEAHASSCKLVERHGSSWKLTRLLLLKLVREVRHVVQLEALSCSPCMTDSCTLGEPAAVRAMIGTPGRQRRGNQERRAAAEAESKSSEASAAHFRGAPGIKARALPISP